MPTDELLTRWTIRLALGCYVAVLAGQLTLPAGSRGWQTAARFLWTAGCLFFLGHVFCAFQFYHDWSNARAVEDTAQQTKELMGWAFGEGIYVSYAFTLLWVADVLWSWISPGTYWGRSRAITCGIHGFMLFIAFNGAIVFEGGVTRWCGIAACLVLLVIAAFRWRTAKRPIPESSISNFLNPEP